MSNRYGPANYRDRVKVIVKEREIKKGVFKRETEEKERERGERERTEKDLFTRLITCCRRCLNRTRRD